jgi:hypothetical protein
MSEGAHPIPLCHSSLSAKKMLRIISLALLVGLAAAFCSTHPDGSYCFHASKSRRLVCANHEDVSIEVCAAGCSDGQCLTTTTTTTSPPLCTFIKRIPPIQINMPCEHYLSTRPPHDTVDMNVDFGADVSLPGVAMNASAVCMITLLDLACAIAFPSCTVFSFITECLQLKEVAMTVCANEQTTRAIIKAVCSIVSDRFMLVYLAGAFIILVAILGGLLSISPQSYRRCYGPLKDEVKHRCLKLRSWC